MREAYLNGHRKGILVGLVSQVVYFPQRSIKLTELRTIIFGEPQESIPDGMVDI